MHSDHGLEFKDPVATFQANRLQCLQKYKYHDPRFYNGFGLGLATVVVESR